MSRGISISRLACVFQTPPCRSKTAICCREMAGAGMRSHTMSSSFCPNSRSNFPPWSQNEPSRNAKRSNPVFEQMIPYHLRMLAMNHDNDTKSAGKVDNGHGAQLVSSIIEKHEQIDGCCQQTLCLCEVVQASRVQDDADSHTLRISAAVLRELCRGWFQPAASGCLSFSVFFFFFIFSNDRFFSSIYPSQVWLTLLCFRVFWLLSFIVFLAAVWLLPGCCFPVWLLYSCLAAVWLLFSCLAAVWLLFCCLAAVCVSSS